MKVALIDNMNNNFFAITRYLRDLGVDAHLYVVESDNLRHFEPQNDTFRNISDCDWIRKFPFRYLPQDVIKSKRSLRKLFEDYDKIVACGVAMSYLHQAGVGVDLFIPFGSDLNVYPFLKFSKPNGLLNFVSQLVTHFNAKNQARAIQNAKMTICNTNWQVAADSLEKLRVEAVNLPRLMIYKEEPPKDIESLEVVDWSMLDNSDFVIFSPTRHLWKTNAEPTPDFEKNGGAKRNDKLFRAYARIVNKGYFQSPKLVLFEYGADLEFSRQLIKELNIEDKVVWMPLMARKDIMRGMTKATFIADQFRQGFSATSAGTTNEAMACGVPVIANSDGAIFDAEDPYFKAPILESLEEEDIDRIFEEYIEDPEKYQRIGEKSKQWFDDNLGAGLARKYLDLLSKIE